MDDQGIQVSPLEQAIYEFLTRYPEEYQRRIAEANGILHGVIQDLPSTFLTFNIRPIIPNTDFEHRKDIKSFYFEESNRVNLSENFHRDRDIVIEKITVKLNEVKSMDLKLKEAGFDFEKDSCIICLEDSDFRGYPKTFCCDQPICICCFTLMMYSNNSKCPHCRYEPITVS